MIDKDIGQLWKSVVLGQGQHAYPIHHTTKNIAAALIRKLVEERAFSYTGGATDFGYDPTEKALRDFGIDPATWPEE